jgi:hypothetical protein
VGFGWSSDCHSFMMYQRTWRCRALLGRWAICPLPSFVLLLDGTATCSPIGIQEYLLFRMIPTSLYSRCQSSAINLPQLSSSPIHVVFHIVQFHKTGLPTTAVAAPVTFIAIDRTQSHRRSNKPDSICRKLMQNKAPCKKGVDGAAFVTPAIFSH